jgi:hypothetical protein
VGIPQDSKLKDCIDKRPSSPPPIMDLVKDIASGEDEFVELQDFSQLEKVVDLIVSLICPRK